MSEYLPNAGHQHKICCRCRESKPVSAFYADIRHKDGLMSVCRTCHNQSTARWTAAHKEQKRESNRAWAKSHREQRQATEAARRLRPVCIPESKLCCFCKAVKPAAEFHRKLDAKDGLYPRCKLCRQAGDRQLRMNNAEYLRQYEKLRGKLAARRQGSHDYYIAHKLECTTRNRLYALKNRERVAAHKRTYVQKNGHYNVQRGRATPRWRDPKAIVAIYAFARRLTQATGISHNVHHIVPIHSKLVCGLHVENNLQAMTARENAQIGNRWWPDMP